MGVQRLNRLIKTYNLVKEIRQNLKETADRIDEEYVDEIREQIEYIIRSVIDEFYEDYPDPIFYRRKYDLYNAVKFKVTRTELDINASYKNLEYKHGYEENYNEYIYNLTFIGGYHGGADIGPGHPNPGVPYYRNFPTCNTWTRPALRASFSPAKKISRKIDSYLDTVPSLKGDILFATMKPSYDKLSELIKKL